ncbi:MAG: TolC family protein [Phycisphaerales bacterium]
MHPRHALLVIPLLLAACGAKNPLWPDERTAKVPPQRLRDIEGANLGRFAKPPPPPQAPPEDPAAAARARFANLESLPFTIEEARASALEHNLDLRIALVNPTIAGARVDEERARFEAAFTTRALWQETDSPTASTLVDAQQRFQIVEPGVRVPLRSGGTATVSLPITRNETSNPFTTLNPSYTSDLAFSIAHPLLRGAGTRVAGTAIEVAGYNRQISEAQTKLAIINQLSAVERTYWRLYQARRELEVRQRDYELAVAQHERAERVVNAGTQPEIEVLRAQAAVAQRLGDILLAQNAVLAQQRELKRVVNVPGLELGGRTLLLTATEPAPVEYLIDGNTLAISALQNRMEMLELELQLLADAANIHFDRSALLPRLDLDAAYRINGLGGTMSDSFTTLRNNKFEDWSLGATLEVPLGNEAARSRLRQSVLARLQRLSTRESRKLLIRQEVFDAIDRIDAGWSRIIATRQAAILSGRTLQAEQRQFDLGASTGQDVLNAQTLLAQAQLEEVRAVVEYQLAQVDLAAATGNLLGAANIRWRPADPSAPAPPPPPPAP